MLGIVDGVGQVSPKTGIGRGVVVNRRSFRYLYLCFDKETER